MNPVIERVTERIIERSRATRGAYLMRIHKASHEGPARSDTSCSNLAHVMAASSSIEKEAIAAREVANLGIITAFNDMLSAHQPFGTYPAQTTEPPAELLEKIDQKRSGWRQA